MPLRNYINRLFFPLFLFFCVTQVFAQFSYVPYYGKNKIQYGEFKWNTYKTEHFKLFHYIDNPQILQNIAEMAESAYKKISLDIKHSLSAEVPIIYYKTYTDFEQTNLLPAQEGILGVSEPTLYRVIIYGDLTLDQIQALIEHELSHIFEFDILFGTPGGSATAFSYPPGWIMEGWPEYNTATWDPWSLLIVRDAALNDRIPELTASGNLFARYPLPRVPDYDFGHAMFDFIKERFGEDGIREFWQSLKKSPLLGRRNPLKRVFKMTNKQFNHEFKKYLRGRFKDFLLRENPEDYSISLGPEFPLNPYYFALSHAVSPSGDIVAVLTMNYQAYDIDILLISTKDGSVIKNITSGYTINYEYIRFSARPARGADLAWSNDGDTVAFFGRSGEKYALIMINPLTGNTERKILIPYDQPTSPCFYVDDKELLFTAFDNGIHDIFKVNLETEAFLNLTEDTLFEKAPAISPDGKQLTYTIRLDKYDKLFLSPLDNLKRKTQLTFGSGNTISPYFSPDSKEVYFSGDTRGAYNIYSVNLETGEQKRFTDVRTGNFFPIPLSNNPKKLIFSSFNKGALQIFMSEFEGEVEKTVAFDEEATAEELELFKPLVSLEINKEEIKPHKGFGKLYLAERPPVDAYISSDGSIYGGGSISLSDILGDYTFSFSAFQFRSFRSYQVSYFNQKRRLQYMASAFQYTLFYYSASVYDPTLPDYFIDPRNAMATRKITGAQFGAFYPFSRFYRAEASIGYYNYEEEYFTQTVGQGPGFWNGNIVSADIALVGETTRFRYPFGPVAGNTFRISLSQSIPVSSNFLQNTTVRADLRQYLNLGGDFLIAFRFNGFASRGRNPYISYWGGNNEVRSMDFYSITGTEGWYANAEFRIPLVGTMSSIIGQLGPIRGVFFFDMTRSKMAGSSARIVIIEPNPNPLLPPTWGEYDAVGSWGYGFEFFFLGLPFHIEFAKLITIDDFSKPFKMDTQGKFRTIFWIGFDF
jgi:Tol biopolymer transport system component